MKNSIKALKMLYKEFPLYIYLKIFSMISLVVKSLFGIFIVDYIIDKYYVYISLINSENNFLIKTLTMIFLMFIGMFILFLIDYLILLYSHYVERNFTNRLNLKFFNKLSNIDYSFHESPEFLNDYMRSLEDGPSYIFGLANNILDLLGVGLQILSVLGVIMFINWTIIIYVIILGILYFLLRIVMSKYSYKYQTVKRPCLREANYSSRAFLLKDSIPDIKTTDIDKILLENNDKAYDKIIKNHKEIISKRTAFSVICDLLITLIYPSIVLLLAYSFKNDLDVSVFASLTVAATTLSLSITKTASTLGSLQENLVEVSVPFNLLNKQGKIEGVKFEDINEHFNSLDIKNVSFSYDEKTKAIDDISIHINKGEKIAIVGMNGAGKTTLVKLLLRLYDVDSGSISINNNEYINTSADSIRKLVGAVFQNPITYACTIAENIILKKVETEEDKKHIDEALKFSGLYEEVYKLKDNINTIVTKEFSEDGIVFSGGNIQKLAIARGYAQNYELFILDEPSSSLDPLAESVVYNNLLELGKDKTLIFISHRLTSTVNADKIYLFEDGKIKEQGTHEELMKLNSTYKKMFESQASKYIGDDYYEE